MKVLHSTNVCFQLYSQSAMQFSAINPTLKFANKTMFEIKLKNYISSN